MAPRFRERTSQFEEFPRFTSFEGSSQRPSYRPLDRERVENVADVAEADLGRNYKEMADTIAKAANTINELVKRSHALRSDAEAAINSARAEANAESERADRLQSELDAALLERSRMLQEQDRRIRELNADKQEIADQLERVTADLELANQWLDYLSGHVQSHLSDTIRKAEALFRGRPSAAA